MHGVDAAEESLEILGDVSFTFEEAYVAILVVGPTGDVDTPGEPESFDVKMSHIVHVVLLSKRSAERIGDDGDHEIVPLVPSEMREKNVTTSGSRFGLSIYRQRLHQRFREGGEILLLSLQVFSKMPLSRVVVLIIGEFAVGLRRAAAIELV